MYTCCSILHRLKPIGLKIGSSEKKKFIFSENIYAMLKPGLYIFIIITNTKILHELKSIKHRPKHFSCFMLIHVP